MFRISRLILARKRETLSLLVFVAVYYFAFYRTVPAYFTKAANSTDLFQSELDEDVWGNIDPIKTKVIDMRTSFNYKKAPSMLNASVNLLEPRSELEELDLLSNLSSKTKEFKEYPGYFSNFTYFYLNSSRVSDIPSQYSIPGTSVCSGDVDLLVIVISVIQHSDWRLLIRQTWASPIYDKSWSQKDLVKLVFFFGNEGFTDVENLALFNESKLYGDIVVASFKDSYGNLSLKLATALTWASKHCPHAKFVAKVDMDVFLHIDVLLKLLHSVLLNYTNFIIGYKHTSQKPAVLRAGKWAVPRDVYPYSYFPNYIFGPSYVLTGSVVHKMAASFPFVHIVPNEDAFITGIMAVRLNITRLGNTAFAYLLRRCTICDLVFRKYLGALYRQNILKQIWENFTTENCSSVEINYQYVLN
ncbi:beta-1,3-galactosyltransferase 1-like [Physella acuta]|uniref:beta-1,3-galactosyltransferase 1-like n=1 Tax=Physella acuta TaxID=109671 RepID=UPI0027DE0EBC|nr:beta-1,3-galactosyltransferase 1-like [Physella acuta]